jgi:hypothetical protein
VKRLWLLNLDADDELATEGPYAPRAAVRERIGLLVERLGTLVPPGDEVALGGEPPSRTHEGLEGRAWSPTPTAVRTLERAGARPAAHPPLDVLRRVAHRGFALALGPTATGARLVTDSEEVLRLLERPSPSTTGEWLLKRVFGFSGRGHRRVRGAPSEADGAFVQASLRKHGALLIVPWAERLLDVGQHGHLDQHGTLVLGEPTVQHIDPAGAWVETRRPEAGELPAGVAASLADEGRRVGVALFEAGYFGPFGVDGFLFRDAAGFPRLEPRCDVNPRYTMGWSVGMAGRRVDLAE